MKNFLVHISRYIVRGFLAIIPLLLCVAVIAILYKFIDKKIIKFLAQYINFFDIHQIPGLGILLLLMSLYLIGLIFSNVLGRQILKIIDSIIERIPIFKFIYGIGKQISDTFAVTDPEKQAFKKAVLVNAFNGQGWMLGFITGNIKGQNGEELLKVFIPTAPHPLTGLILMVTPSQTMDCGWSVEEAIKMIVSVGIVSPASIKK